MNEFRRPRWIILSVFVLAFSVASIALGFWQLRRLDERRAQNEVVASRLDRTPVGIDDIRRERESAGVLVPSSDLEFTLVEATGRFLNEGRVLVRSQVANGLAGTHGVYALDLGDDTAVLVNIGWFPLGQDPGPIEDIYGSEPLRVLGLLRVSQSRPRFGQQERYGRLDQVARVDVGRIQQQVSVPLEDYWIQLMDPNDENRLPIPAKIPDLDEGAHLSYAIQWFSFALIAVGGYLALVRKEVKQIRRSEAVRSGSPNLLSPTHVASD